MQPTGISAILVGLEEEITTASVPSFSQTLYCPSIRSALLNRDHSFLTAAWFVESNTPHAIKIGCCEANEAAPSAACKLRPTHMGKRLWWFLRSRWLSPNSTNQKAQTKSFRSDLLECWPGFSLPVP